MNGQFIVAEQLREHCIKNKVDIALVQEPPSRGGKIPGLDHVPIRTIMGAESDSGAAIIVFNPDLELLRIDKLSEKNIVVATVKQKNRCFKTFIPAYFKFNIPISDFITKLTSILSILETGTVIGVDSNAHSDLWHSKGNNNTGRVKGRKVKAMINDLYLKVHNKPNQPNTYSRTDMGSSNIDITISTKDLEHNVKNWRVNTNITDSDHRLISFTLLSDQDTITNQQRERTRYNVDKADWDSFKLQLIIDIQCYKPSGTIEQGAESLVEAISKAAKFSIPTGGPQG